MSVFSPTTCAKSYVCAVREAVRPLDRVKENLEMELFYAWKQVEICHIFELQDREDDWLGVAADVEIALQYVNLARERFMDSLPDVLLGPEYP